MVTRLWVGNDEEFLIPSMRFKVTLHNVDVIRAVVLYGEYGECSCAHTNVQYVINVIVTGQQTGCIFYLLLLGSCNL